MMILQLIYLMLISLQHNLLTKLVFFKLKLNILRILLLNIIIKIVDQMSLFIFFLIDNFIQ